MSLSRVFVVSVSLIALSIAFLPTVGMSDTIDVSGEMSGFSRAAARVRLIVAHRGASTERPECTIPAIERAIEVGATAVEVDVRTSKDGKLFIMHDATLNRTTNGKGPASALTLQQLRQLDAGSWFDEKYAGTKVPSLAEVARVCRGKIDLLLDLKEQGEPYARRVAAVIQQDGDPRRTIVGVRSVEQAKLFRKLLPQSKQLGFIPDGRSVDAFAKAEVDWIRLWPKWIFGDKALVERVRGTGKTLLVNGSTGDVNETLQLLAFQPDAILVDDPRTLKNSLAAIVREGIVAAQIAPLHDHPGQVARIQPLAVPKLDSIPAFRQWQSERRRQFVEQMLYRYRGETEVVRVGRIERKKYRREEFHVLLAGRRLFRFFRLVPLGRSEKLPTVVCFMGHGKVVQILDETRSYQHACADAFAKAGYLVYAMENVGMEPGKDTHLDLDQSLRLEGHGWYSLLFAHQRMLLDQVFADRRVDQAQVGVTGVSTGGLLALSAAAMEPRIAAASVQGIFGSMRVSFVQDRNLHCRCGAIPNLLPKFDLPELALLVAPRPLHISNGERDGFSPGEAKRCIDSITPLYRLAGGTRPEATVSPGGHAFHLESALAFFKRQLMSEGEAPFPGKQSHWNGFPRYDFEVDGKPVLVVAPRKPAAGKPWVWHGEFFGHKPAPDIELLERGFHIVYMRVPDLLGAPRAVEHWNKLYEHLTSRYGLAEKVALVGLSRGGLYCYNWAAANPTRVACIYGDAPVCDFKSWPGGFGKGKGSPRDWKLVLEVYGFKSDAEAKASKENPVDQLAPLAKAGVPLLHVYGEADQVVPWDENTGLLATRYRKLGGSIELIAKPGVGHHPHSLNDPTPIVHFILKHTIGLPEQARWRRDDMAGRLAARLAPTRTAVFKVANGRELYLHIFEPEGWRSSDRRSCFVVFHGGGWTGGDPRRMYPFANHFAQAGMVGISVQYRLARSQDGATVFDSVRDARSAIRFIRSHAANLGIDPAKIVVSGGSAGGHLAAGTALFAGVDDKQDDARVSSIPNALVLLFPVIDTSTRGYGNKKIGTKWRELSPLHRVGKGAPPTIVFHGTADTVTPFSGAAAFRDAMVDAGNRCELVAYKGGKHGYLMFQRAAYDETLEQTEVFLRSLKLLPVSP